MAKIKIRDKINAIAQKAKVYDKPELYMLVVVASLFLPFVLTGVALVGFFIYIIFMDKQLLLKSLKTKYSFLLIVFCGLTFVVSVFHQRWIGALVSIGIAILFLFFLTCQTLLTRELYDKALDICCVMSIWCFVYALVQKLIMGWGYRSTAGLLNANYYATMIEFVILICVYRIITRPNSFKRYIPVIAINVAGLFLCDCQSSWLPIFFGVLVLLYFNGYKKHAGIFVMASIVLGIFLIVVPGILPRLDRMPQTVGTRQNIWDVAVKGIRLFPIFGQGPMAYMSTYERFGGYKTYHAHSLYLDPLLCFGIVGVLIILAYVFTMVVRMYKSNYGKDSTAIKSMITASVIAVMVHGFTDYSIFWIQTGTMLCFILSGFALKATPINHTANRKKKDKEQQLIEK